MLAETPKTCFEINMLAKQAVVVCVKELFFKNFRRRARKSIPINVGCAEIPNNKTFAIESTNIRNFC